MPSYENTNPSILERKIALILSQGDILFLTEFSFPDLKSDRGVSLRFDFAVFETPEDLEQERPAFLIEANGAQHYERRFQDAAGFARQQANDKRKRAYCAAKGLVLVEIPYLDYNNITLDFLLEAGKFF